MMTSAVKCNGSGGGNGDTTSTPANTTTAGLRDRVTDQIDQAFDVAARAGFATCVAILLVAAAVSALTLPSRPYAPS